MDDLVGAGKIADAVERSTREFRTLVAEFLTPSVRETGELIGDRVKLWRLENQIRAFKKADAMLKDAGITPKGIDARTLLPLVEGASVEDEEELSAKWAGLLASAAAGDEVPTSYAKILAQLTPAEAKALDRLSKKGPPKATPLMQSVGMRSGTEIQASLENLLRLGLIRELRQDFATEFVEAVEELKQSRQPSNPLGVDEVFRKLQHRIDWYRRQGSKPQLIADVRLTRLGHSFVRVCQGPKKRTAQEAVEKRDKT